ncbi:MAG: ABC transporter ATP-binding protein, partial [Candidatus Omnitrophica bacterium]|nr:ABC transporter ATP-binding protein [Candidatus Omnitrophota bacterium]
MLKKILSVKDISKRFNNILALDAISFTVSSDEILGLLGPNGAGKSTTINILLGLLEPNRGEFWVDGLSMHNNREEILQRMNFFADYAPLPGNLTVFQNLYIFSIVYGIRNKLEVIDTLLRQFDLEKYRNTKTGLLSSGEQTRLGLAKAMLNSPKLLLLDEPTASLDPSRAKEIRSVIKNFVRKNKCGVLWTSHNMYEVEEVCDRVIFLFRGR